MVSRVHVRPTKRALHKFEYEGRFLGRRRIFERNKSDTKTADDKFCSIHDRIRLPLTDMSKNSKDRLRNPAYQLTTWDHTTYPSTFFGISVIAILDCKASRLTDKFVSNKELLKDLPYMMSSQRAISTISKQAIQS